MTEPSTSSSLVANDAHKTTRVGRIDFHHHFYPPFMAEKIGTDTIWKAVGYVLPEDYMFWTPEKSLGAMNELGIEMAILSLTGSPSPNGEGIGEANRNFARKLNLYISDVCKRYPDRFGFFANIPIPGDTEAALAEIAYALDVLHADGINLASSYGKGEDATYLGDPIYEPVWAELNRRQAVVFVHGNQVPVFNDRPYPHALLGLPIISVPVETFKTAASLVLSGIMRTYPNCKVILSHFGGATPFLAARVALLSSYMNAQVPHAVQGILRRPITREEILQDFKRFYYDSALAGYDTNLLAVENFAGKDKMVFGTDFPAVTTEMADWSMQNIDKHYADVPARLDAIMRANALRLLPQLKARLSSHTTET